MAVIEVEPPPNTTATSATNSQPGTPNSPLSEHSGASDDGRVNKPKKNTARTSDVKLNIPSVDKPAQQQQHHDTIDPSTRFANQPSPLENIGWIGTVYCGFMTPMILLGRKRQIELDDVWEPIASDKTDHSVELIRNAWEKQMEKHRQNPSYRPSLFWALFDIYGISFIMTGASEAIYYGFQMIQPFALKALILYVENHQTNTLGGTSLSVWYALILAGTVLFCSFAINYKFYRIYRFGCQMRSGLMAIIYEKALKLSAGSRTSSTIGQTMNIVSNDTSRIFDASLFVNTIFVAPVILCVTMGLLGWQIGVPAVIAVALMVVLLPLQAYIGAIIGRTRRDMLQFSDHRVKLMSEILNGIRVIKCYCWERPMSDKVQEARKAEVKRVGKSLLLKATNMSLLFAWPVFITFFTFLLYVYLYGRPSLASVFVLLAFLNVIRFPISMLPYSISNCAEAKIGMKRIEDFLMLDELKRHVNANGIPLEPGKVTEEPAGSVIMRNASWRWNDKDEKDILHNINIDIKPGQLVAVIGSVGSGKSSILSSILGEMFASEGAHAECSGRVAYVAQKPWIQNQSIRSNILFNSPYDDNRYKACIHAAALEADLAIFPAGDLTEIGEQGLNLSGGQKARCSLARALYRSNVSDVYLLDDVLSAVDMHVAKHLMNLSILKVLQDKTRVVVLNSHLHFLPKFDRIIVMEDGAIKFQGTFDELKRDLPSVLQEEQMEAEHSDELMADIGDDDAAAADVLQQADTKHHNSSALSGEQSQPADTTIKISAAANAQATESQQIDENGTLKAAAENSTAGASGGGNVAEAAGTVLIKKEDQAAGSVSGDVMRQYFAAASKEGVWTYVYIFAVLFFYAFTQTCQIMTSYWLTFFASDYSYEHTNAWWFGTWAAWVVASVILLITRSLLFTAGNMRASANLHDRLFRRLLRAPTNTFYDVTPVGRIINRFSKDVDQVDLLLPDNLGQFTQNMFLILSIIVLSAIASWYFVFIFIPTFALFWYIQSIYRKTSRELKRLDGTTRSPIFSTFGESLSGLSTIRAYAVQQDFLTYYNSKVDTNTKCFLYSQLAERWLSIRIEFISAILVLATAILVVTVSDSIPPARIGIALTYSLQIAGVLQYTLRLSIMVETTLTSVERLVSYSHVETEAPDEIEGEQLPEDWPSKGEIVFEDLQLRYRPELDLVLKGVSLDVKGKEKIGVCGRTGSGKSTMMLALFRLVEAASGRIFIDGVDISTIGLNTLRSKIGIIPQDSFVVSGTIRYNLDPFDNYSDEDLWDSLEKSNLAAAVRGMGDGLQSAVAEGGENISHGQRQLLCIARALLRKQRILVLDEATASIDLETDKMIQDVIRQNFNESSILTIAHRLDTIIDYSRVLVMDHGRVKELDTPYHLLRDQNSAFHQMIAQAGESNVDRLTEIAKLAEESAKRGQMSVQMMEMIRQASHSTAASPPLKPQRQPSH